MKIKPILEWNIIGHSKLLLSISATLVVLSICFMLINVFTTPTHSPFNFGVDFTGGVVMNLDFDKTADEAAIRSTLGKFNEGGATIQRDKKDLKHIMIRLSDTANKDQIIAALEKNIGKINRDTMSVDTIGPVVGAELRRNALLTMSLALLIILIYTAFRFQWKHGLAAVLALIHDVGVSLGALALFKIQLNVPTVAAVLSIIAYSLQDSIVILDRLRENIKYRKGNETFGELANRSVTESWTRSFNTSFTTVIGVAVLTIFVGASLRDFTTVLLVGLVAGTYSSIYIVVPLVLLWEKKEQQSIRAEYILHQADSEKRNKLVETNYKPSKTVASNIKTSASIATATTTPTVASKKKKTNRRR
jgi:preprotein translocase subunit SecF